MCLYSGNTCQRMFVSGIVGASVISVLVFTFRPLSSAGAKRKQTIAPALPTTELRDYGTSHLRLLQVIQQLKPTVRAGGNRIMGADESASGLSHPPPEGGIAGEMVDCLCPFVGG